MINAPRTLHTGFTLLEMLFILGSITLVSTAIVFMMGNGGGDQWTKSPPISAEMLASQPPCVKVQMLRHLLGRYSQEIHQVELKDFTDACQQTAPAQPVIDAQVRALLQSSGSEAYFDSGSSFTSSTASGFSSN